MRNFRSEAEAESVRPSTSRKRSLKFFLLDWPFPAKQFPVSKWPPPPSDSSGPFGGNVRPNKKEDGNNKSRKYDGMSPMLMADLLLMTSNLFGPLMILCRRPEVQESMKGFY